MSPRGESSLESEFLVLHSRNQVEEAGDARNQVPEQHQQIQVNHRIIPKIAHCNKTLFKMLAILFNQILISLLIQSVRRTYKSLTYYQNTSREVARDSLASANVAIQAIIGPKMSSLSALDRRRKASKSTNALIIITVLFLSYQLSEHFQCTLLASAASHGNQQYQQHNNILHFVVPEGAPNKTYLGNIRSADGQPPYLVLPAPQTPESERVAALSINLINGDLTTNSVLDREHREQYHFVAIVREPFAEIKCTVTVKDVNDNAPMFLMPTSNETNYVIEMPENQRGVRKLLPLAIDFDTPQFGIKEFRIVSGNTPSGTFQLVEHEAPTRASLQNNNLLSGQDDASSSLVAGSDNPQLMLQLAQQQVVLIPSQPQTMQSTSPLGASSSSSSSTGGGGGSNGGAIGSASAGQQQSGKFLIDLEVNQMLDRENQSSYQLVVEAIDGGQPPLLGRLMVTVNVQDANDNDPVFVRKHYECQFREDSPKGTLILRVQAHDADLDANGQISYFIKRQLSSQPASLILQNSNSSDNIESTRHAVGSNNKIRQQSLSSSPQSSASKSPSQRSQQGNEIYSDSGQMTNTDFKNNKAYNTNSNNYLSSDQMFEMDPIKGELYLTHQLDFETEQVHELVIEARDHGKPSRSGFAYVKVFVTDVNDDPPPTIPSAKYDGDKRQGLGAQAPSTAELSKSESIRIDPADVSQQGLFNMQNPFNLINWFAQINSSLLFVIVLVALFAVAFPVCLVKIKSRQPESDYNDTAGLTLTSNNGQAKQSPNHSTSNEHHPNGSPQDSHHRHLHDHQRRSNGSFVALQGAVGAGFGSPNGKLRYQYIDSSNLYHNPYPQQQALRNHSNSHHLQQVPDSPTNHHQIATGGGGSGNGTMVLHGHHHHALLGSPGGHHRSLERQHQFPGLGNADAHHHSSSLTYAHHNSRAPLLHQAHHHQSSHHLSASLHHSHLHGGAGSGGGVNVGAGGGQSNKGGTMNSVGTHQSAHPSASPLPATPNTTHSSGLPPNTMLEAQHGYSHGLSHSTSLLPNLPPVLHPVSGHQQTQLPPTPCNVNSGMFPWPHAPGSTMGGCFAPGPPPSSQMDCAPSSQPLDRWFDLGVSSQLIYAHDWFGSYNWDYLSDWAPEYQTLMPLIESDA